MSNIDKVRVGNTDYPIEGFCKVYDTLAQMQADIANIPSGCMVYCKENSPSGMAGDSSLDTTSQNWVKNSVVATAINTINTKAVVKGSGSSTPSISDRELRQSDISTTPINNDNKVASASCVYNIGRNYVEVTGNGSKTYATLLAELNALIDSSKVTPYSMFTDGNNICPVSITTNGYFASLVLSESSKSTVRTYFILSASSAIHNWSITTSGNSYSNLSSSVVPNNHKLRFYY